MVFAAGSVFLTGSEKLERKGAPAVEVRAAGA
jgi:hypothetical protein